MTDTATWARIHVLDLAIANCRKRQLAARAEGSEFLDRFWSDLLDENLAERLMISEQMRHG